jgi:ADP-glucose pyrophosphorylase
MHLLHDILGNVARPNWAVVMAGGKGMRLRPLTEKLPKPMIRVAGRPLLERIILHLVSFGIHRIFLSVNHLASVIETILKTARSSAQGSSTFARIIRWAPAAPSPFCPKSPSTPYWS